MIQLSDEQILSLTSQVMDFYLYIRFYLDIGWCWVTGAKTKVIEIQIAILFQTASLDAHESKAVACQLNCHTQHIQAFFHHEAESFCLKYFSLSLSLHFKN
jgi:hypothetical protein